jgi:predicted DNA-binding transcriptional regulator AlpA
MATITPGVTGRKPADSADRAAFSVDEFCARNGISRSLFYKLVRTGKGPATMRLGVRTLITGAAEAAWHRVMEQQSVA